MPQDSSERVRDYLDTIEGFFPEIYDPRLSRELTRLKGIIQFSTVEAIGFSWYESNWHRQDRFIVVSNEFDLDLIDVALWVDEAEIKFPYPPKSLLWVFSRINEPLERSRLWFRYIINPL